MAKYDELFISLYQSLFDNNVDSYSVRNLEEHTEWADDIISVAHLHTKAILNALDEEE